VTSGMISVHASARAPDRHDVQRGDISTLPWTRRGHFVEAIGHLALDAGKTVAWHTLATLAHVVHRCRANDSVTNAIGELSRSDLVRASVEQLRTVAGSHPHAPAPPAVTRSSDSPTPERRSQCSSRNTTRSTARPFRSTSQREVRPGSSRYMKTIPGFFSTAIPGTA